MSEQVVLRRYEFRYDKESDWAIIIVGSDGSLFAQSGYGTFGYIWTDTGMKDFRVFLLGSERDWDYFVNKLVYSPVERPTKMRKKMGERFVKEVMRKKLVPLLRKELDEEYRAAVIAHEQAGA